MDKKIMVALMQNELKKSVKNFLRPAYRPLYRKYETIRTRSKTFSVPLKKLLRGGENGIRAAKYAELTNDFLRPSTSVFEGPHVRLLKLYDELGDEVFKPKIFEKTDYYKNASECMGLTGRYFYDTPDKIKTLAERFVAQYQGKKLDLSQQPGQSDAAQPIWVRPIRDSSCYEMIDGNHRVARAIMRGDESIPALIYDKEAVYTPLQRLLLDCLWIKGQKWLYQPVDSPELKDQWHLIRKCTDRLEKMKNFLEGRGLLKNLTYMDLGSSYGWFVKEMENLGFDTFGMEGDPFGMDIGFKVYGVREDQILHQDLAIGLREQVRKKKRYDIVSCFSVLHHFALGKNSTSAEEMIKKIDQITGKVLFFETGEEHEASFQGTLKGWNPEFIEKWIKGNTSFKKVIDLGTDDDRKTPFEGYYNRTLFACVR